MEGLYEVTLEANRGLRQQPVLETILVSFWKWRTCAQARRSSLSRERLDTLSI
jgi:hypothetical protein